MSSPIKLLLPVLLAGAALAGCGSRGELPAATSIEAYEQAMRAFPGSTVAIDAGIERFKAAFRDLTDPGLAEKIHASYAEALYFNDTLHTFQRRDDLAAYLARTGSNLSESSVAVHQVVTDGADVYVRWTMEFRTRAVGRSIHSRSIGISHLRFDDTGQVVLHQDFWDSGHGLYAHLPWVGFAVRRARSAL